MFGPASGEGLPRRETGPCGDLPRLRSRLERPASERDVSQSGLPLLFAGQGARAFRRTAKVAIVSATLPATPRMIPLEIMRWPSCLEPTEAPAI